MKMGSDPLTESLKKTPEFIRGVFFNDSKLSKHIRCFDNGPGKPYKGLSDEGGFLHYLDLSLSHWMIPGMISFLDLEEVNIPM